MTPVLDTSAIITLLGCGEMECVMESLGIQCIVEERVLAELIYHPLPGRDCKSEMETLERKGYLRVHRMTTLEYDFYLDLVGRSRADALGSGESAAIAVAFSIRCPVVLDDKKARRICEEKYKEIKMESSFTIFAAAAKNANWPKSRLLALIKKSMTRAGMGILRCDQAAFEILHLEENGIGEAAQ